MCDNSLEDKQDIRFTEEKNGLQRKTLYTYLVRPHLQYYIGVWQPHGKRDKTALEEYTGW